MRAHVVLVGLMGAGKTTVGRLLAEGLDWPFRDCDELLERRAGVTAAELAEREGIDALHLLEAEVLVDALELDPPSVVTAAASTIEDDRCRRLMREAMVVWLTAPPAVLAQRANRHDHRPLADDAQAQIAAHAARRDPLFASVAALELSVDVDTPATVAERIREVIATRGA